MLVNGLVTKRFSRHGEIAGTDVYGTHVEQAVALSARGGAELHSPVDVIFLLPSGGGGALTTCFSDKTASRPGYRIGRSEFAELRPPFWIAARKSGTHKVCVCIYHENAKFMIKGPTLKVSYKELCQVLSKLISEFSLQSSFYYDFSKQLHLTTV